MKYQNYLHADGTYVGNEGTKATKTLSPAVYTISYNEMSEKIFFIEKSVNYDAIIDLPSKEYDSLIKEMDVFLKPETKATFKEFGFLYKRSSLLYGKPGTGKTMLVNRMAEKVIEQSGVVLLNPDPRLLVKAFKVLEDIQPDTLVMVIFEELDELAAFAEKQLLLLLDGEVQKNNVIYMATTNFIDKVPTRLKRPGRFSSLVEVKFPNKAARRHYLSLKLPKNQNIDDWVNNTHGLSVDELKEAVLAVFCLSMPREEVLTRIIDVKKQNNNYDEYAKTSDMSDFDLGMRQPLRSNKSYSMPTSNALDVTAASLPEAQKSFAENGFVSTSED